MPQKIYIVRHGETDYNAERRTQGWLDIPLNKTGHAQAMATSAKLVNIKVDALYSSDLRRAHETADTIARTLNTQIVLTKALRERDMGVFSGWRRGFEQDLIKDRLWSEFETARDQEDMDWNEHGGESMRQMTERIAMFMNKLHVLHTDQKVIIVSHGGTINRILEHYHVKSSSEGYRMIGNASVLVLTKQSTTYSLEEL